MANVFTLLLDHRDKQTEIIYCKSQNLKIRVMPRNNGREYKLDDYAFVFTATFWQRGFDGKPVVEQTEYIDFEIMNAGSEVSVNWNKELFIDGIVYYCKTQHGKDYDLLGHDGGVQWEQYNDYDDLECSNNNQGAENVYDDERSSADSF